MSKARWKLWKLGHFQNAGTKKLELVTIYFIFSRFQAIFYLDLHFFSISSTRGKKTMQRFVLCYHQFFFAIQYFIFQMVITSWVYKFSGCERNLLKEPFFQFVILKNSQLINCISSLFLFLFIFFGLRWCAITFHNNWMCHYTRKLFCLFFNLKVV